MKATELILFVRVRELANSDMLMAFLTGETAIGRATGSQLTLVTTARGTVSNFHVPRLEGWTRMETFL